MNVADGEISDDSYRFIHEIELQASRSSIHAPLLLNIKRIIILHKIKEY